MTRIYGLDADIYFGDVDKPLPDWRNDPEWMAQEDPDDELEPGDPNGAIAILGYDPFEEEEGEKGLKFNPHHDELGRFASGGIYGGVGDGTSGGGSGGRESFGMGAEALHQIHLKEKEIVKSKAEVAVVFDNNGKCVLEKIGDDNEVRFTNEELERLRGNTLTHNHPPSVFSSGAVVSVPPSPDDLGLMLQHQMKQLRTVTKKYVYVIKPPKTDVPSGSILRREYVGNVMNRLDLEMKFQIFGRMHKLVDRAKRERVPVSMVQRTVDGEQPELMHKAWKIVSKEVGIGYKRVKR